MRHSIILLSLLSALHPTRAQTVAAADGPIVPFTSTLPLCATDCGPLFDVQGKCSPPNIAAVDTNCFCTDTRLTPFDTDSGTTGVSAVCGTTSCTAAADLQKVKDWYDSYCATSTAATTANATSNATGTSTPKSSSGSTNSSWISTHYQWVIMLVVVFVAIVGGWVGAFRWRRYYLRKREREFELKPPVAWGPHQQQAHDGGYSYGDGVIDAVRGGIPTPSSSDAGGHYKEAAATILPREATTPKNKRASKALKKNGKNAEK